MLGKSNKAVPVVHIYTHWVTRAQIHLTIYNMLLYNQTVQILMWALRKRVKKCLDFHVFF